MAYKPTNIASKQKYLTDVSTFEGVDYSTQRFKVNASRAIDLSNFLYKDGVVQVRNGVEELYEMQETYFIPESFDSNDTSSDIQYMKNEKNINGMWSVTGEDDELHLIAHIGYLLYEIKNIENPMKLKVEPIVVRGKTNTYHNAQTYYHVYMFENYKSSAFVGSKRLYFLGGNQFVCLRFLKQDNGDGYIDIFPIEDHEDTYIPTTTISITYKDSAIPSRASLDKVNLMTEWRVNELLSGTLKKENLENLINGENASSDTNYYDYTLDSPLICKNTSDMSNILITLEYRGKINYGRSN